MVIKYVFETGGKTLQELTNFPISGGRSRCSRRLNVARLLALVGA